MQNLKEEFKEYSDVLDSLTWDEDFFDENLQLSDVENKLQSQHLIKNLQFTNNREGIQSGSSSLWQEVACSRNIATSKWKEIKLSNLCAVNTSRDLILQKEQKSTDCYSRNKTTTCIRKHPDEQSDSEDFCAPNKKRKKTKMQSMHIFVKPNKAPTNVQTNLVNSRIDGISIIEVPTEDMSKSQSDMTISSESSQGSKSQETVGSQNEIKTPDNQKMTKCSQSSQNSTSSSQSINSLSPKKYTSSQESLGNKILNIKIDESNILSADNKSEIHTVFTPNINSKFQKISYEKTEISKSQNMDHNVNSQKLMVCNEINFRSKDAFLSKKMKTGFPEKNKFTKNVVSFVNDYSCIKRGRCCNKEQKKVIWNIRKRELEVTKRENAVENREKLLDAREADIQKREKILKAKEGKYLRHGAKIKNKLQKHAIKTNKLKKTGILEDGTNSFNTRTIKKITLVHVK